MASQKKFQGPVASPTSAMPNLIKTSRLLRRLVVGGGVLLATSVSIAGMTQGHAQAREFDRTKLPIAEPRPEKVTKVLPQRCHCLRSGR